MKKRCIKTVCLWLLTVTACGALLCGCGEAAAPEPEVDYDAMVTPPVDLTITDCLTETQLSAVLGYPMQLLGVYEDGTQALYQSQDGACMVTLNLKNQTRGVFDAEVAAAGDKVTLYEGVGETAYWSSETGELLVYANGYSLGVAVSCEEDAVIIETYTRQITELVLASLSPTPAP